MVSKAKGIGSGLTPSVSPVGAWALSLGTTIGWGSLVVTSNTYLMDAGPWGSFIGLVIGAAIMVILGRNYHYLINCFPGAGGAYTYSKEVFGYDHGFLTAWFLGLTYFAILWANATSLPLFSRYFIGNIFRFGYMYSLFGYDVYFGETLLSIAALALVAFCCSRSKKVIMAVLVGLAVVFCLGILTCFLGAAFGKGGLASTMNPAFIPNKSEPEQVIRIACISPWAFIGFENISHASEEYTFQRKKVFRILTISVATATVLYLSILLLSAAAYPPQYHNWLEYISDLKNLSGIEGLPAFYAAQHFFGQFGVLLLIFALFGLVVSSLIGNILALSRLLYSMGKDSVIPKRFGRLNKRNLPGQAILLIAVISAVIMFVGRTAVGWIVDVTTIGATLTYGFVSACVVKIAKLRRDKGDMATGVAGLVLMILFVAYLLLSNLFTDGWMEKETFFLLVIWGLLGFVFFRLTLSHDKERKFGKSIIVWIGLLFVVLFISMIWMNQSLAESTNQTIENVNEYYEEEEPSQQRIIEEEAFLAKEVKRMRSRNVLTTAVVTILFGASLAFLLTNFAYVNKRARKSEEELGVARKRTNVDPLTGVKSRYAYLEKEKQINAEITAGTAKAFAVVVCDINGLKMVNDTKGHKAGDELICAASRLICEQFAQSPVFRIGGDEFVVIPGEQDHAIRSEIMKQLNQLVEENVQQDGIVVAVGISEYVKGEDETLRAVFDRADAQMYQRKQELKSMGADSRS